jgi:hypothetical protein
MRNKRNQNQRKNHFKGKNDLLVRKKLTKAFKLGLSNEEACYFADISLCEFKSYEKDNPQVEKLKEKFQNVYQLTQKQNTKLVQNIVNGGNKKLRRHEFETFSVDHLVQKYAKIREDIPLAKTDRDKQFAFFELSELEKNIIQSMNLETKELMLATIPDSVDYKGFSLELAKNLERDFDVKTATEKSLVQMAVLAFVSYLQTSREVMQNSFINEYSKEQKVSIVYLTAVSKEKNNALRQYTTIIQTLKNLKASPIKFNIVTQTLNMGQQQQINNTVK